MCGKVVVVVTLVKEKREKNDGMYESEEMERLQNKSQIFCLPPLYPVSFSSPLSMCVSICVCVFLTPRVRIIYRFSTAAQRMCHIPNIVCENVWLISKTHLCLFSVLALTWLWYHYQRSQWWMPHVQLDMVQWRRERHHQPGGGWPK